MNSIKKFSEKMSGLLYMYNNHIYSILKIFYIILIIKGYYRTNIKYIFCIFFIFIIP